MPSVSTIAPVLLAVASVSTAQPFQVRDAEAAPINFQNGWNRAKSWTIAHKGQIEHDGFEAAKIGMSAAPLLLMREAEPDFGDDMLDTYDLYSRDADADADPFFSQAASTVRNQAVGGWNWARGHKSQIGGDAWDATKVFSEVAPVALKALKRDADADANPFFTQTAHAVQNKAVGGWRWVSGHKSEIGGDAWDATKVFSEVAPVALKALKRDQILSELRARDLEDLGLFPRDADPEAMPPMSPRVRAAWTGAKNRARGGWQWVSGHKMEIAENAGEAVRVGADLAELAPKAKRDAEAEADWNAVQQRARQQFHAGYGYLKGHKMAIAEDAGEAIKVGADLAELAPKAKRDPEAELYDDLDGLYARDIDGEESGLFGRYADADADPTQNFNGWYVHEVHSPAFQQAERNTQRVAQVGGKWVWSNMGTIKNGLDAAEDVSKLTRGA